MTSFMAQHSNHVPRVSDRRCMPYFFLSLHPPPYALPLSCSLMLVSRLFYFSITITQNTLNLFINIWTHLYTPQFLHDNQTEHSIIRNCLKQEVLSTLILWTKKHNLYNYHSKNNNVLHFLKNSTRTIFIFNYVNYVKRGN